MGKMFDGDRRFLQQFKCSTQCYVFHVQYIYTGASGIPLSLDYLTLEELISLIEML